MGCVVGLDSGGVSALVSVAGGFDSAGVAGLASGGGVVTEGGDARTMFRSPQPAAASAAARRTQRSREWSRIQAFRAVSRPVSLGRGSAGSS